MSFFDKARQAAEQARQTASQAAVQAKQAAGVAGDQARQAAGQAGKSLATMVERIDPSLLADLIIKATALQERANVSLQAKHSPYRVAEIVVTATIPPQISFSIARLHGERIGASEVDSSQLVAHAEEELSTPIFSLDASPDPITAAESDGAPDTGPRPNRS